MRSILLILALLLCCVCGVAQAKPRNMICDANGCRPAPQASTPRPATLARPQGGGRGFFRCQFRGVLGRLRARLQERRG